MYTLPILGALWINVWLTPAWLMGVGVLVGIVTIAAILAACFGVSLVPGIDKITGNRWVNSILATIAAVPLAVIAQRYVVANIGPMQEVIGWYVLLALLVWAAAYGVISLTSKRAISEIFIMIREGVLWPLMFIATALSALGVVGGFAVPDSPLILESFTRLTSTGSQPTRQYTIKPSPAELPETELPPEQAIPITFSGREIERIAFESSQHITIEVEPDLETLHPTFQIEASDPNDRGKNIFTWDRREVLTDPFGKKEVTELYVRNYGVEPAVLKVDVTTTPAHPQARGIAWMAIFVVMLFLVYACVRQLLPKVLAVSLATYKSETAQPFFLILVALGTVSLVLFLFIPYNTFGEDLKMVKTSGLTLILVLGIVQAVWSASNSITDEIEGRTALTVLSKPLRRRDFIIGKYVGISWTILLMYVILTIVLVLAIGYKPIFESRESTSEDPTWQLCYQEIIMTMPGVALAFMETLLLCAISVAISTRLGMVANFALMFVVYVLGHLTPLLVQSSEEGFQVVHFVGNLIAVVFPNLDHFRMDAAIAGDKVVPLEYVGMTFLYFAVYTVISLLLGLIMFEDRDLT